MKERDKEEINEELKNIWQSKGKDKDKSVWEEKEKEKMEIKPKETTCWEI